MEHTPSSRKQPTKSHKIPMSAMILSALLGIITLLCVIWIVSDKNSPSSVTDSNHILWADIYQNGELIYHINLSEVTEPYTFTVTGDNGCTNEISVQNGSIGILQASCPDKLCVHQGFIHSSLLPITCLPNHLVIQVREEATDSKIEPDIVTY